MKRKKKEKVEEKKWNFYAVPTGGPKPHTCPVCLGAGTVIDSRFAGTTSSVVPIISCQACKGECVLWG